MSSNYDDPWNEDDAPDDLSEGGEELPGLYSQEVECRRCRGIGEDEEGADCIVCEGWGSVYV